MSAVGVIVLLLGMRGDHGTETVVDLRAAAAQPTAPPVDGGDQTTQSAEEASWDERLLRFVLEIKASASSDRLRQTIAQKLPLLLGVEHIWIMTRFGRRRQVIAPEPVDGKRTHPVFGAGGEWATFPLTVSHEVVGLLAVEISRRRLSPRVRHATSTIAPLLAEVLSTAHTIERLRELSSVDSVTGCATRQNGLERLRAELTRARRANREVAILLLDLDYFKSINDRFGHSAGDVVLANVGRTIMETLRVSDIRCRWGGEEFLVALPETGLDQAKRVAAALARRVAETVTDWNNTRLQITTSIGVTIALPGDVDVEGIIARADAAMYRAKADGRSCIRVVLPHAHAQGHHPQPDASLASPAPLPFRERRNPVKADRRQYPGPGRRSTDIVG